MTPEDLANVARLRNLQSQATASINALVWRISDTSDSRPSTEQWAELWPAFEAATVVLQRVADQLAAEQAQARAQQRRRRDATARDADQAKTP